MHHLFGEHLTRFKHVVRFLAPVVPTRRDVPLPRQVGAGGGDGGRRCRGKLLECWELSQGLSVGLQLPTS